MEERYYELSEDTIKSVVEVYDSMYSAFELNMKFIGNSKLKQVIKLNKTNPLVKEITGHDLIVEINEDLVERSENEDGTIFEILTYQEFDRIESNLQNGTFKIKPYPVKTTLGVIQKYGIESVANANEIGNLAYEQSVDDNEEE